MSQFRRKRSKILTTKFAVDQFVQSAIGAKAIMEKTNCRKKGTGRNLSDFAQLCSNKSKPRKLPVNLVTYVYNP
jgi:hypothetical protein